MVSFSARPTLTDEKVAFALNQTVAYVKNVFGGPDAMYAVVRDENPEIKGPPILCYGRYMMFADETGKIYKITKLLTRAEKMRVLKSYQVISHRSGPFAAADH